MVVVLEKKLTLHPEDEKTNVSLPFTVPEDSKYMYIDFSYFPKILDDKERTKQLVTECLIRDGEGESVYDPKKYPFLLNLVTITLYGPEGFAGAAHRQDAKQNIVIGGSVATKGFFPRKIKAGQWTLTLNVHALVTESCECTITVKTRGYNNE